MSEEQDRGRPIEREDLPPKVAEALFPEEAVAIDLDDDDLDVVAMAKAAAARGKKADAEERKQTRRSSSSTPQAGPVETRRHPSVEGIPQALVDAALAEMEDRGIKPDVRRIHKAPGGGVEIDLT
jgi:hypothetical protein